MNISQLKYFLAVAENLNFSATADELCISQSSLSKHIKTLEEELEVQLFVRSTRSVKLTDAGKRLKFHAEKVVDEYEEMLACVKQFTGVSKRSISIASIPVLAVYGITDMIAQFQLDHAGVNIQIQERDAQFVLQALENHEVDIGMLRTKYLEGHKLKTIPILDDEMVLVVNRGHRFAKKGHVGLAEAANERFFLLGESTFMYQVCVEECSKAGFFPSVTSSGMRMSTIQSFVKQGTGISLLMRKTANVLEDPDLAVIDIDEHPVLTLAIVTRDDALPPFCLEFINFATAYFNYPEYKMAAE